MRLYTSSPPMISRRITSGAIQARRPTPPSATATDSQPSNDHLWWGTAAHEAGHALVALLCERHVSAVQIHDARSGFCYQERFNVAQRDEYDPQVWRRIVKQEIIMSLAGGLAEAKMYPTHPDWDGCQDDLADASSYHRELRRCGVKVTMDELIDETQAVLNDPYIWRAIRRLTPELVKHRRIDAATVSRFLPAIATKRPA